MKTVLKEGMSLHNMEKTIVDELQGKQLWGDIDLSTTEYEILRERLKVLLLYQGLEAETIALQYPVAFTTLMVFLARYKYSYKYWGLLSEELEIPINGQIETALGKIVRKTFSKYSFDFSDVKNERRVNLEPIFYEAGLPPESSLDDLFYILNYDSHNIFDPQLIIEDLIEMRSYQIRKPMLKFLKRFRADRAVEFVMEVHEAMLCVDHNMASDSHYIGTYSEWKTREGTKESINSRKKQEFQTKPYLSFDNEKNGLCIVLPRVVLKEEWIEEVCWRVTTDTGVVCRRLNIFGDEGKRFIDTLIIPVSPSSKYLIDLIDEEDLDGSNIGSWNISGIAPDSFILFNSNGRQVSPNYIPEPFGIIVSGSKVLITATKSITISRQFYPTDRAQYKIHSFEVNARDAKLIIQSPARVIEMTARQQAELIFSGDSLFSLDSNGAFNLYTSIPDLTVSIGESAAPEGLSLRIGTSVIDIDDLFFEGKAHIELNRYGSSIFTKYGIYSIRLYQNNNFIKQTEFTLIPRISSNYSPTLLWPTKDELAQDLQFRFKKQPDLQMEFKGCIIGGNEDEYIVTCPSGIGSISVILTYDDGDSEFTCTFDLPIRAFESDIVNSDGISKGFVPGKVARIGLTDLLSEEMWSCIRFFGNYRDGEYQLKLRSVNGIEQEEPLAITRGGSVNSSLYRFYDTLQSCPLPAQLELWKEGADTNYLPLLTISNTLRLSKRPLYVSTGYIAIDISDENRNLIVTKFGNPDQTFHLLYTNSRVAKSGRTRGYKCPYDLNEGFYIIESNKENSIFEFEDDAPTWISNDNDTLYICRRNKKSPITCFSDWLDQLIYDILRAGIGGDICNLISYNLIGELAHYKDFSLSCFDYERLISLAYFINDKCSNDKKKSIKKCMSAISDSILSRESRLELIRYLAKYQCPAEIIDTCIEQYRLLLFSMGAPDALALAEVFENDAIELSLLMRTGAVDNLRNVFGREKYRDIIGKESIKVFLDVPDEGDPSSRITEQRNFLREQPSHVRINITQDISGDMDAITSKMLKVTYNKIIFDKSKKPDIGVYFDHIRYVDQYVNWYFSHTDPGWIIKEETRLSIINVVRENCKKVVDSIEELKKMPGAKKSVVLYESALRARYSGDLFSNMSSAIPARYFYLQGLAAFLSQLPAEYSKYGWIVRTGDRFMEKAFSIAPRIARRDLLMASVYIYLKQKEELLCQ